MEGKKRYIAIILFLLICLMVFTFATTGDEELEQGNGSNIQEVTDKENSDKDKEETKSEEKEDSKESSTSNKPSSNSSTKEESTPNVEDEEENLDGTGEVDNSAYDKALEAVEELESLLTDAQAKIARDLVEEVTNSDQFKELMERIEDAEDAIDANELVEKLEQMVKEAAEKADITDAKDFRDDEVTDAVNEIDGENLEDVKEDLLDRIEELSKILDDDTAPTVEPNIDGLATNEDVSLTIKDINEITTTVKKDGNTYEYVDTFTEEGTYEVTVVDAAFNDVTVTFTIDKTKPKFEGLASREEEVENYVVDVTDATATTITMQKDHGKFQIIEEGYELTEEGTYQLVATDAAGNKFSTWIHIDKTLPTIEDIEDGEHRRKDTTITVFDRYLKKVVVDGVVYTTKDFTTNAKNEDRKFEIVISEEGEHTITAIDNSGKSITKTFTIDKTKPQITGVEDGAIYNHDVTPIIVEENIQNVAIQKDGKKYTKYTIGMTLTEDGVYKMRATDKAGNKFDYITFTIDKTAPKSVSRNIYTNGVKEGTTYYATNGNKITAYIRVSEQLATLPTITFHVNGKDYVATDVKESFHKAEDKENGIYKYEVNVKLDENFDIEDGELTFTVSNIVDKAGNTLEAVSNATNKNKVIIDRTHIMLTQTSLSTDVVEGKTYYVKNGDTITFNIGFNEMPAETPVVTIGGKKVELKYDKYYEAISTYLYRGSVTIPEDETEMAEGELAIVISNVADKAGNKGFYYTKLSKNITEEATKYDTTNGRQVIYDRTPNRITQTSLSSEISVSKTYYVTNGSTIDFSIGFSELLSEDAIVTIGGKKVELKYDKFYTAINTHLYRGKLTIAEDESEMPEGKLEIVITNITDKVGNKGFYYQTNGKKVMTIYKNVETTNGRIAFYDITGPKVTPSYKETTTEQDEEFTNYPTFEVKDNSNQAVTQELISGSVDTTTLGVYTLTYRFTDIVGNYTDVSIKVKVVDTKAPTIEGLVDGAYYNTKDTHAIPVAYDKNGALLFVKTTILDNEVISPWISGKEITQVGTYKVYAVDKFGNKSEEITINIDPYAPKVLVLDRFENISGAYLPIKPVILEHNLDTIEVELDGKKIDYKTGDQLTKDGKYKMTVTDKAGNSTTVEFTMDSVAPTMLISPTSLGVVDSLDLNDVDNITGLLLSEEAEFQLMKAEKNITILDKDIPIYKYTKLPANGIIDEEGEYILIAYDKAYNLTAYKFIVDRSAPTVNVEEGKYYSSVTINVEDANMASGTLEGLEDLIPGIGEIISSLSKLDPSITIQKGNNWLDKKAIENGYVVDEDGTYTLVAKDVVGVNPLFSKEEQAAHTTTVTFHIDTKNPTANVVEGGVYNKVTVKVDDAHLDETSITINDKKYDGKEITEKGTYVLKAKDLAGNILEVNFEVDPTPIKISGINKNLYNKNDVVTIEVEARDAEVDIKLNGKTITSGHKVSEQGNYLLIVTDKWGNVVQKSFTIDATAPVIINPFNGTEITIGKNPNGLDIVANVTDGFGEYPKTVQPKVTTIGSNSEPVKLSKLNTSVPGKYELRYNVKDAAGNAAEEVVVTVNVIDVEYTLSFAVGNQVTYTYDGTEKSLSDFAVQLYSNIDGTYVDTKNANIVVELVKGSKIKDAGIYTLKATVNNTSDYPNATSAELTVTIKAKEVKATFESNLDGLSSIETYQFNGKTNPFKVTLEGVVEGESLSTTIDYGTKTFAPGTYTATASLKDNDFDHNYIITNKDHKYVITKAETYIIETDSNGKQTVKNLVEIDAKGNVTVTNTDGYDITAYATIKTIENKTATGVQKDVYDGTDFIKVGQKEECYTNIFTGKETCKMVDKYDWVTKHADYNVSIDYKTIQVVSNQYMSVANQNIGLTGMENFETAIGVAEAFGITIVGDLQTQVINTIPTTGTRKAIVTNFDYTKIK